MQLLQIAATAAAIAFGGSLSAKCAELAKSGEVQLDNAVTYKVIASSDAGEVKSTVFEGTGIGRSHGGEAPFQLLAIHCLGHAVILKGDWKGDGSCTFTDKDGDSFMSFWHDCNDCKPNDHLVGGSGKFAGITGSATGKMDASVYDDPLRGWAFIGHANHKWEIK